MLISPESCREAIRVSDSYDSHANVLQYPYNRNHRQSPTGSRLSSPRSSGVVTTAHILNINVCGKDYCIPVEAFQRPKTLEANSILTRLEKITKAASFAERTALCDLYDANNDRYYFFGHSPELFEAVVNSVWTGQLHIPRHLCPAQVTNELTYWNVPHNFLVRCCTRQAVHKTGSHNVVTLKFADMNQSVMERNNNEKLEGMTVSIKSENAREDPFKGLCCPDTRKTLWNFLEDPKSSNPAKYFAWISVGIALLSILIMVVGSMPDYQYIDYRTGQAHPHPILNGIEIACITFFGVEYLLRLWVTPYKCEYVKAPLQIIDVLTILPTVFEMVCESIGWSFSRLGSSIKGAFLALRLLRVLRVMRVFRLARYHHGLKHLGETLKSSRREIGVLCVFFTSLVLLFSTTVYYLEKDEPGSPFISIPAACWWCVITITTVGYGDIVPISSGGRIVSTVACLSGIIVLAFPITMIIENFNRSYKDQHNVMAPLVQAPVQFDNDDDSSNKMEDSKHSDTTKTSIDFDTIL